MKKKHISGFTLIELLVVIGILSILLAILNAVNQYMADNQGSLPTGIDTTVRTITNDAAVTDRVDLCTDIVSRYIAAMPGDPTAGSGALDCSGATYNTGYRISRGAADNRITVSASGEIDTNIAVTR